MYEYTKLHYKLTYLFISLLYEYNKLHHKLTYLFISLLYVGWNDIHVLLSLVSLLDYLIHLYYLLIIYSHHLFPIYCNDHFFWYLFIPSHLYQGIYSRCIYFILSLIPFIRKLTQIKNNIKSNPKRKKSLLPVLYNYISTKSTK